MVSNLLSNAKKHIETYIGQYRFLEFHLSNYSKITDDDINQFVLFNKKVNSSKEVIEILPEHVLLDLAEFFNNVNNIIISCKSIIDYASKVENYDIKKSSLLDHLQSFIKLVWDFNKIWSQIQPVIFQKVVEGKLENLENRISGIITQYDQEIQTELNDFKKTKSNLEEGMISIKERYDPILNRLEILNNAIVFSTTSTKIKTESFYWLMGVGVSIIGFVITLVALYKCFPINVDEIKLLKDFSSNASNSLLNYAIAKNIGFRIIILSFASFIVGLLVKNYNNCRHNATIYAHKSSSLFAALQLLEKAKTPEGNDNLMIQASSAIFSHQSTVSTKMLLKTYLLEYWITLKRLLVKRNNNLSYCSLFNFRACRTLNMVEKPL